MEDMQHCQLFVYVSALKQHMGLLRKVYSNHNANRYAYDRCCKVQTADAYLAKTLHFINVLVATIVSSAWQPL